jgi:hypothetical protein
VPTAGPFSAPSKAFYPAACTDKVIKSTVYGKILTLSNPIFLPTAYSPALICFGRERGWWITCNYPTVLKERNRKSTTCAICWLMFVLHEEKRRTGSDSGRTNATRTASDVIRHRSEIGKSYRWTRFDVGSERDKMKENINIIEIK